MNISTITPNTKMAVSKSTERLMEWQKKPSQMDNLRTLHDKMGDEINNLDSSPAERTLAPTSEDKSGENPPDDGDFMDCLDQALWQTMVSLRKQQGSLDTKIRNGVGNNTKTSQEKPRIYSAQGDCDMVQHLDVSFRTFSVSDTTSIGTWSTKSSITPNFFDTFTIDDVASIKSFKSRKSMDISSTQTFSSSESMSLYSNISRKLSTSLELQQLSNKLPLSVPSKTTTPQFPREPLWRAPKSVLAHGLAHTLDPNCDDTNSYDVVKLSRNDNSHLLQQPPWRAAKGDTKLSSHPDPLALSRNGDSFQRQPDKAIHPKKGNTVPMNGRAFWRQSDKVIHSKKGFTMPINGRDFGKQPDKAIHPKNQPQAKSAAYKSAFASYLQNQDVIIPMSGRAFWRQPDNVIYPKSQPQAKPAACKSAFASYLQNQGVPMPMHGRALDFSYNESTQSPAHTIHKQNNGEFGIQTGHIIPESAVRPADVKMGQSPKFRDHSGNKLLRNLVCQNYDQYYVGNKQQKTRIAEDIMNDICIRGGRFLKQPNNQRVWVVVGDLLEVRDKVASSFRCEKKMRSEKKKEKIEDE